MSFNKREKHLVYVNIHFNNVFISKKRLTTNQKRVNKKYSQIGKTINYKTRKWNCNKKKEGKKKRCWR